MRKIDSLHQLVLNLTGTEKRLFKIYVKKHSTGKEKAYLDLFDAFAKMKEFSESALLKKLPKSYNTKNIAQNKKYLKDLILKCMREIDDNRAEDSVNELMREQVFLGKKNMFKEQWKRLQKAKEITIKYELFSRYLEILDAEMTYLIEHDFDQSLQFYEEYTSLKKETLWNINEYNKLTVAKNKVFQLLRKYRRNISNEQLEIANKFVKDFDETEILKQDSFQLNMAYYNLCANFTDLQNQKKETTAFRFKMVKLCQSHPWMIEGDFKRYLITYFNYLASLFSAEEFIKMKEELNVLENLELKNENDKGELFQNLTLYKILYWLNTGKLDEAAKEKGLIEKGVKLYDHKINASSLMSIYFNYSLAFFCNDDYVECINWLEKIEEVKKEVRLDLKVFAKVLIIICHYQLGNYLLIESLVRSLRRKVKLKTPYNAMLTALTALSSKSKNKLEIINKLKLNLKEEKLFVGSDIANLWMNSLNSKTSLRENYLKSIA